MQDWNDVIARLDNTFQNVNISSPPINWKHAIDT